MGTQSIQWKWIGARPPAPIEAAPHLAQRIAEKQQTEQVIAQRLRLIQQDAVHAIDGEPAGPAATALVLGCSLLGTAIHISLIHAAVAAIGG